MNKIKKIWLRLLSRISNKISSYVSRQIIKSLDNKEDESHE